jgi:hypothetical protein
MHFEILVEDQSGEKMLNILIPKIIGSQNTFKTHYYKGIGRLPKNLNSNRDPVKRILLAELPRLLRGYGKTFSNYTDEYPASVIVVCDLDNKCLHSFRNQLIGILNSCNPKPETRFCIAIEEGEAWLLGDINAVIAAYPKAKAAILQTYNNDSICGTWEVLADAIYTGGAKALLKKGWQSIGYEKSQWAENITPNMEIDNNQSPSFNHFCDQLLELSER